jgi:hypothetical protein
MTMMMIWVLVRFNITSKTVSPHDAKRHKWIIIIIISYPETDHCYVQKYAGTSQLWCTAILGVCDVWGWREKLSRSG